MGQEWPVMKTYRQPEDQEDGEQEWDQCVEDKRVDILFQIPQKTSVQALHHIYCVY